MARSATLHHLPFRILYTRPIPSFHQNDLVRAKTASPAPRHRIPGCCQHRAPRRHSSRTSPTFSKGKCPSKIPRGNFLISKRMVLRMPAHHRSWPTKCDRAAFLREYQRRLPTLFRPAHSNLGTKGRRYPQSTVLHSLSNLCRTRLKASIPNSRNRLQTLVLLRIRMQWLVAR